MLKNKSLFALITLGALTISSSICALQTELTGEQLKAYLLGRLHYMTRPSISDSSATREIDQITETALKAVRASNRCYDITELIKMFGFKGECTYTTEYVETALRTAFLEHVKQKATAYGNSVGENVALVIDSIFREHTVSAGSMRDFIGKRFDVYIEKENNKHMQEAYAQQPNPAPTSYAYAPTTNAYPTTTPTAPVSPVSYPSTGSSAGGGAPTTRPTVAQQEEILMQQASHRINNEGQKENCSICLEPLKDSPAVGYPQCQHGAHVECAKEHIFGKKPCWGDGCKQKMDQEKLRKNPKCDSCGRKLEVNVCQECRRPFDSKKMSMILEVLKTQQR